MNTTVPAFVQQYYDKTGTVWLHIYYMNFEREVGSAVVVLLFIIIIKKLKASRELGWWRCVLWLFFCSSFIVHHVYLPVGIVFIYLLMSLINFQVE